ncbi:MAG: glycosyltransferase family 39 protein [Nitrospirae bacterium]|nr:MAG: glycosyltransferase family 39 protein [Nitrospirota bacterium]
MLKEPKLLLLLALAGLLFLLGLGTLGLTDRDEGSNAEAAREMVESGDWITPTLNGEPRFAKPVFLYWLISGAYRLFGVGEFTARLPSALFGLALILLQYWFLARVRGATLGFLGALMLLLNVEIVAIGRLVLTDSVLIFFTTLALFGFWLGFHGTGKARHYLWLLYIGMALGTLTKGPIGFAVPLLAIVPYLTITHRWRRFWQTGFPLAGSLLFLALALPWYGMMLAIHGARYTASAQADTIGRFLNVIGGHGGTLFFYVPVLLFGFFPWSGFLPVALYQGLRNWRGYWTDRRAEKEEGAKELELFASLWIVATFVFFSASATRLPHYIGPLFPAAALLTAAYWHRCLLDQATAGLRASLRLLIVTGSLLGFGLAASPSLYAHFVDKMTKEFPMAAQVDPGLGPPAVGFILIIGTVLVGYFGLLRERRGAAFWAASVTISLVLLVSLQITVPRFSRYFVSPPQELAFTAGVNLGPDDRLILYGPPRPSLIFYAKRKAILIKPGEEAKMQPHLTQPGRTMIMMPSRLKPQLPPEAKEYQVILERYGYSLLSNEPMVKGLPDKPPVPIPRFGPHG